MTTTASAVTAGPSPTRRAGNKTRRRFLILSVAALAVLATALGISFTADTGVTTITGVTNGGTSSLVYTPTYGTAGGLPTALTGTAGTAGTAWKYGTSAAPTTPVSPSFPTIVAGTATQVSTGGDVAMIDATDTASTNLLVTVYVTNMQALGLTYNSYSLPIRVYAGTASGGSIPSWTAADGSGSTYLTNTGGYETFTLPTGTNKYYEVTLDSGGSLYPYQTGATGAALAPSFYITAQRSS